MPRFLTDENFDHNIIRGLFALDRTVDLCTVQDVGLMQTPDPVILDWAAQEGRVLVTHDVSTVLGFAFDRVRQGLPMPGVLIVQRQIPIGQAIAELLIAAGAGTDDDFKDLVKYIPMGP